MKIKAPVNTVIVEPITVNSKQMILLYIQHLWDNPLRWMDGSFFPCLTTTSWESKMLDVKRAYRIARSHIYMIPGIGKAVRADTREKELIRDIEVKHRGKVVKVVRPEKWLEVVHHVLRGLPCEVRKAVEWHYFEGDSAVKISYKSYVGVRTLYDWFDNFVRDVAVVAVAEKLIR